MNWLQHFQLPLLAREMIEQSGKKRTYAFRVVYCLALFLFCGIFVYAEIHQNGTVDPFRILGRGDQPLVMLLIIQFFTVYIFLPAVACGAIAGEKERQTLPLLFLTRLSPWTILLEKALACLVPFLYLSLPAIPLLMLFYSLGGVDQKLVWGATYCIFLATMQTTAMAIFCSAFFRKSVTAFVMTWIIGFSFFVGPPICMELYQTIFVGGWVAPPMIMGVRYVWWLGHFPPYLMDVVMQGSVGQWLLFSLPVYISTLLFVLGTRWAITAKAFTSGNQSQRRFLRWIDSGIRFAKNALLGTTRSSEAGNDPLPFAQPVLWREQFKTVFGVLRYQLIAAAGVFLLLWLGLALAEYQEYRYAKRETLFVFHFGLLIVLLLTALIRSACLIAGNVRRKH